VVFIVILSKYYPGSLGEIGRPTPASKESKGSGDLTLDFTGWDDWKDPLSRELKNDAIFGKRPDSVWLLSGFHFPGAHFEHYYANPLNLRSKVVGKFNEIHNFFYTNPDNGDLKPGDNAVWLEITNYDRPFPDPVKQAFDSTGNTVWIPQVRNGAAVRYLRVTPLYHYRGGIPATGLIDSELRIPDSELNGQQP
jgi:hypothetical protein